MASSPSYRVGVDVGGTNTDAVILDVRDANGPKRGILAFCKTPTTAPNVTDGIETAVRTVLEQSVVAPSDIGCLTIGTTHFINAIIEHDARRLAPVAIIRLSKSFLREVPPFSDFPPALAKIMHGYYGYVDGGLHIDGSQESPIVEEQVVKQCAVIREKGIDAIAICGIFSPIDEHFHQEQKVRDIVLREIPGADVVCSSDVSQIGFLERENAAILNASIMKFARRTVRGFRAAMKRLNLNCALYLTQNDGTLIDAPSAARLPIRTFSSGPTNSMRGAAYLAEGTGERTSKIVVDIGGTTSDVGVLLPSGFPRQASAYVSVAGVRINFSMPHLESIGLGGGSIIRVNNDDDKVSVGPDSVGHFLQSKARVFGGDTLTTTDIAVKAKKEEIGNPDLVKDLEENIVSRAQARMKLMLEKVIDQMKTSPAPLPVLLVGGGSVIAPTELEGVSSVVCPPFHSVANAVGAAIAKVGGTVDFIQSSTNKPISEIVEEGKKMAIERAVEVGASRESVYVAEVDAIPLQYVNNNEVRVIVRAVGELSDENVSKMKESNAVESNGDSEEGGDEIYQEADKTQSASTEETTKSSIDINSYKPSVVKSPETGVDEWIISEVDLEWLSDGCYVLGCAGGGSPFSEFLRLRDQVRAGYTMRVVDASSLKDDAIVYWGGHMGSPAVSTERLANDETEQAVVELMEYYGHKKIDAFIDLEIGGGNGLQGLALGSTKNQGCPTIDADFMAYLGRAYPTYWQTTLCAFEEAALVPCAIASGDGKTILMTKTTNDEIVDRALRAACSEMGSRVGMAAKPTTKHAVVNYSVLNTVSLAWRIGRTIACAHATNTISTVAEQMIEECGGPNAAKILFRGKIISVERRLFKGHSHGELVIQQVETSEQEDMSDLPLTPAVASGGVLRIPFKNENIYAKHVSDDGTEKYIATVPDLISVLDTQSGRALGVPEFRYGVMVTVLGITCSPRWTQTKKGLEIGGPAAFGYDIEYKPLGEYKEPRSVVLEYASNS
ncbi:hypothetical protein UA08_04891 [Talaromyces atroroseus]|uniref:Hydantoinase/oxoprolinase n=1 Tax=Talaromyces atroroseus TaxID=1441469 RepID=A0A225AYF4_TALAT|nr:hypothetical protein UA08_04891 [Talaromyces atroroseus]OKL60006.1 hypothetical protein UA08_04891 [Talaromyces atroroseus]